MSEHHSQENDYTDSDIRLRPLVIFLVATLVVAALTIVGVKLLFNHYHATSGQIIADVERQMLEARPTNAVVEGLGEATEAMRRMKLEVAARLDGYRKIEGTDFVQIPIDLAMQKVVAQGLPVRAAVKAAAEETPVQAGQRLFAELGCIACHGAVAGALGPSLTGVYGHEVDLADGRKVLADEAYVRESILEPMASVVAGYAPVMPAFKGIVTDDQLDKLVAYIKSIGTP
ncbi:MAG TPA: c-type cytochrome [Kiritimatiellia bacterium]|nr:c-type cytochrome [Kiritimatiellia bacterium]HMP35074.1 c-type cytochrome [Kiritimatiellia bacterium]